MENTAEFRLQQRLRELKEAERLRKHSEPTNATGSGSELACPVCGKVQAYYGALQVHLKSHSRRSPKDAIRSLLPSKCEICGQRETRVACKAKGDKPPTLRSLSIYMDSSVQPHALCQRCLLVARTLDVFQIETERREYIESVMTFVARCETVEGKQMEFATSPVRPTTT